jgi:allantoate deiminase
MRQCGLEPGRVGDARRVDLAAYVEPHIEQGPVLAEAGDEVGVVERIVGIRVLTVALSGVAGHAGTIPMTSRHDALAGAAEIVAAAERLVRERGAPAVVTVGSLDVRPGGFNQVPGEARFTIDVRHPDEGVLDDLEDRLRTLIEEVAAARGLGVQLGQRVRQAGIAFDAGICAALVDSCAEAGVRHRRMPSHAGHDAQLIGTLCPAAMLFVPSQGGHSHRPDELTLAEHIGAGIEVLTRTLHRLAYPWGDSPPTPLRRS